MVLPIDLVPVQEGCDMGSKVMKTRYRVMLTADEGQTQCVKHAPGHADAKKESERWCWHRGLEGGHKFTNKTEADAVAKLLGGAVVAVEPPAVKGGGKDSVEEGGGAAVTK